MSNPFDQFTTNITASLPPATQPPVSYESQFAAPEASGLALNAPPPQPIYPSYGAPIGYGAPPSQQQPMLPYGMPTGAPPPQPMANALVPAAVQSNPYALAVPAYGQGPPSPQPQYGQPTYGQPPHGQSPYGMPPAAPMPMFDQMVATNPFGVTVPSGVPPLPPVAESNPFSTPAPFAPTPSSSDPWGAPAPQPTYSQPDSYGQLDPSIGTLVVASQVAPPAALPIDHDPFGGVFNSPAPPPAIPSAREFSQSSMENSMISSQPPGFGDDIFGQQPPHAASQNGSDPWADMGFAPPVSAAAAPGSQPTNSDGLFDGPVAVTDPGQRQEGELPPGGEWYDARIFTPTLGVMFFKPQELTDSLFLNTDKELVDGLGERPVVAFIVEGSSARSAGVELGHVLLKVNGVDVKNPKDASRLIKEGPRPLPLLFYVPNTQIVVAEGEHMVKYDTKDTTAPNSAKDWKPKYVVIGGIIAQPWMMNMYRSKSEYDIAVIETQARRPVSVKVKQFSLQGARIQNDWQGPQMVKYKNKLHPWKYIVVLPVARNPIKISSPNLVQLKPCHDGIRRVLLAQQRDRGSNSNSGAHSQGGDPYADSYRNGGSSPERDPYARPPPERDPYAQPPPERDPYAQPPPERDPYAQPPPERDPYAQPPPERYSQPPPERDPYAQPPPARDPYAQPPPERYSQPPPVQYVQPPTHQPQYSAPPPQQQYPPQQPQYGAPPPQQQYPPQQPQYGATPPQQQYPPQQPQYGAPPPQQQHQWGPPPQQPYGY